jgi:hypothetical protein
LRSNRPDRLAGIRAQAICKRLPLSDRSFRVSRDLERTFIPTERREHTRAITNWNSTTAGRGLDSYRARYTLPENRARFPSRWYGFGVSSVVFISLDADDVVYQDTAAFVAGPDPLIPAASTGNPPIAPETSLFVRGEQTRWLAETLRRAAGDKGIDWMSSRCIRTG